MMMELIRKFVEMKCKNSFQVKKYLGKKIEKKELDTLSISNRVAQRDDLLVLNFLRFKPPSSIFNNTGDTL